MNIHDIVHIPSIPFLHYILLLMQGHGAIRIPAIHFSFHLDRVKRIWYLSPMLAAKVQASLRIRAVSPEPSLLAHASSEPRGTFRQKARSLAPLNDWACAVKICHDGMLEDTNSLDGAHFICYLSFVYINFYQIPLSRLFEPRQANLCLRAFRHDKF